MNPEDQIISPEEVSELADIMPPKVNLLEYRTAMKTLRHKKYSYQEIADWMSKTLGISVNRNQVSYVVNTDPSLQEIEDEIESREDEADER